jgi:Arc/MetJ-type ribon-helix-helix transcriptional regulator
MVKADGIKPVTDNVVPLRSKPPESEKITINLGYVDLGQIDLLVQEGFNSNRTDFIRTAIRKQLQRHEDAVKASASRKSLDLGLHSYTRARLEAAQRAGQPLRSTCWAWPRSLRMSHPNSPGQPSVQWSYSGPYRLLPR